VYATRPGSCSEGDSTRTDDFQADLVDLITDLLHLADEFGTSHGALGNGGLGTAESALNHYTEERFPCAVCGAPDADWDDNTDELRCPDHR
jgi:hypothetical protein